MQTDAGTRSKARQMRKVGARARASSRRAHDLPGDAGTTFRQLWRKAFELVFDACKRETLIEIRLSKSKKIVAIVSFFAAITASGSAVAGWALWSTSAAKPIWVFVAGSAAIASFAVTHFGIPSKIREFEVLWKQCADVVASGQRLLDEIDLKRLSQDDAAGRYLEIQEKYTDVKTNFDPNFLHAGRNVAALVDQRAKAKLSNFIEFDNE